MSFRSRARTALRNRSIRAPLTVAALATVVALAPSAARAASSQVQNCVQGVSGELPIGGPNDPGHVWKKTIADWIAQFGKDDFEWVEPLVLLDPVQAYGAGYAPYGNLCPFGNGVQDAPWPAVGASEQLHIEQFWLLVGTQFVLPWQWFTQDAEYYTLGHMIDESSCEVRTPRLAWGDSLAFFASWEYAGSPFRPGLVNNDVLRRRLASWLGLQLIMLDWSHYDASGVFQPHAYGPHPVLGPRRFAHPLPYAQGMNAFASDMRNGAELSGQLALLAWTFGHVRGILDSTTEQAYLEALLTMAERVNVWNPYDPQINRGIRSTYGLGYVWEQTQDPDAQVWYEDTLTQFFDPNGGNWIPGGYWRDDYGFDLGYGGASLMAAERAVSEDPSAPAVVFGATALSQELVARLALPDVDGRWVAPTEFNSRTSVGPVAGVAPSPRTSYYGGVHRYLLGFAAGLPYGDAFLRDVPYVGPEGATALDPRVLGFHENLACISAGYVQYINPLLSQPMSGAEGVWPDLTRSQDWEPPPTYLENHTTSLLVDLWDNYDQSPQDSRMPVEIAGPPAIRNLDGRFVFGRFGGAGSGTEYAAGLHLGEVGSLGGFNESGFGGGQLTYFWTPEGGPTMLGLRKGRSAGTIAETDYWPEWRTFPQHAVWVHTTGDKVTTSARIVTPTTEVFPLAQDPTNISLDAALDGTGAFVSPPTVLDSQATAVLARVSGQIPALGHRVDMLNPGQVVPTLTTPIDYKRTFLMGEAGVWVESKIGDGFPGDMALEVWETFPVWGRDTYAQPTVRDPYILLNSSSQGVVDASLGTLAPVEDVWMIEILREGGHTVIHLDDSERTVVVTGPANVHAGFGLWQLGDRQSQTILIDRASPGCLGGPGCRVYADRFRYFIEELP